MKYSEIILSDFKHTRNALSAHFNQNQIDHVLLDGFTRLELHCAFNLIKNKKNYRLPFKAKINQADFNLCNAATQYFLNTSLIVCSEDGDSIEVSSYLENGLPLNKKQ